MSERGPTRVLVVGAVTLNGGDAALLLALRDRLFEAFGDDTEIAVGDLLPEPCQRRYPEFRFVPSPGVASLRQGPVTFVRRLRDALPQRLRRPRFRAWAALARRGAGHGAAARLVLPRGELHAVEPYLWADIVVMCGGTTLVEHYPLRDRWIGLGMASWLGRPLGLFTQSLGPFRRRGNRRHMRQVAARSRIVLVRDVRSAQHLEEVGVPLEDKVVVSADAAFGLTAPAQADRPVTDLRRVAISVRDWPYSAEVQGVDTAERYRDALAAVTTHLVRERDARVTFVSTCQGNPEYWTDDAVVAREIFERLPVDVRAGVELDEAFHSPPDLLDQLTTFDLVIATRMHMAILGLVAGRPVIPIAYEFKTAELFQRLNAGDRVIELVDISPEALRSAVADVARDPAAYQASLAQAVESERGAARGTTPLLRRLMD